LRQWSGSAKVRAAAAGDALRRGITPPRKPVSRPRLRIGGVFFKLRLLGGFSAFGPRGPILPTMEENIQVSDPDITSDGLRTKRNAGVCAKRPGQGCWSRPRRN
jgi:hypothetical protein